MLKFFKKYIKKDKKEIRKIVKKETPVPLEEGLDYYIENGFYVFTAHYLKNRGYCCGNGCRHCPYQKKEE